MTAGQVGLVLILAMVALCIYEFRRAPLLDPPADPIHALPCLDAAAAILVEELMPEVEQHLREVSS